jgi:hypothetical protein
MFKRCAALVGSIFVVGKMNKMVTKLNLYWAFGLVAVSNLSFEQGI